MIKTNNFFKITILLTVFFMFCGGILSAQYNIPNKPKSDLSLIFNYSKENLLSDNEVQALNQKLIDYEGKTSTQIALIIVDSLNGEDPNFLAANWGHKWGIGQEEADNGLVMLMSIGDRKIAIQNGYGLEEFMTDAKSKQIIDHFIIPYFKQGEFYKGFNNGIDAIINVLEGNFIEDESVNYNEGINWGGLVEAIILFLLMLLLLWYIIRKNKNDDNDGFGGGRKRNTFGDIIFTDFGRSTWNGSSSGGFGSSGGGGFGGFGGGGFGGGGASGGW